MITFFFAKDWFDETFPLDGRLVIGADNLRLEFPVFDNLITELIAETRLDYDDDVEVLRDDTLLPGAVIVVNPLNPCPRWLL